jgi:Domain of unknown function (DUF5666)
MNKLAHLSLALGLVLPLAACRSAATNPAATPSAAVTATAAATLGAQATPATNPNARQMGTVTAINGNTVTLQDGSTLTMTPQTAVTRRVAASPSDIQKGVSVAVTAKRQPDNSLMASEVVLFDSVSSSFYRQFPMDAGNIMTNATVDQLTGNSFTVTFPGGGEHVTLAPDAKVSKVVKGQPSDIKVGDAISASVSGSTAQSVSIQ